MTFSDIQTISCCTDKPELLSALKFEFIYLLLQMAWYVLGCLLGCHAWLNRHGWMNSSGLDDWHNLLEIRVHYMGGLV